MDLNTNLLDRIVSKNPDLGKTDQSIFPASNELDEEESGVNDSGIDVLDLSTPSKQLKSAVFVPETPSPVFSRTSSKRERNDNKQTDDDNVSKRTCQFTSDRYVLPSTTIFSKFASPHKSEESVRGSGHDDQLTVANDIAEARECSSDSAISSNHACKTVLDSQNEKQKQVRAKRFQKECLKNAASSARSSVCQNGYKNAHYGTGYIGWPSDSDDSDTDNICLRDVIEKRGELTNDVTQGNSKESPKQVDSKLKMCGADVNSCTNGLDVDKDQCVGGVKQKIENRNSPKCNSVRNNSCSREKRVIIPRSELTIRNIFDHNKVTNSRLKTNNGQSFRPPNVHSANSRQLSSCRYANTNVNCNPFEENDHRENNQDLTNDSSPSVMLSSYSVANHIPANYMSGASSSSNQTSPVISTTNQIVSNVTFHSPPANRITDSISNACVSPTRGTAHPVDCRHDTRDVRKPDSNQTDKQPSVTEFMLNPSLRFYSRPNSDRSFNRPLVDSLGFIDLHPEPEMTARPSCMFSHLSGGGGVNVNPPQAGVERGSNPRNDVILLDVPSDEDGQQPSFDCSLSARRNRTASRRKSRVSGLRRRGDAVSGHYLRHPDPVIDVDDSADMTYAVTLASQLDSDEQLARRLQEEMDMELAMSLHQAHSAMDAEAHGHFDVNSHGVQLHVSPVRRRGYSNVRQPNSRSRRRQRGGDDDLMLTVDGEGQESVMLPFHQRADMDGHNPLAMMEAHILSLLENPVRRGRRRGLGGRTPRNLILGFNHSGEGNDYEELLALAENLGDVKSKGISTAEINRLPTRDYKKPEGESGEMDDCLICMCEYREGDRQRILTCFHEFHAKCIDKWLKSSATCPVCRVEVRP